jgi:P27 family predicted phage terminase small subunit
MPGTVAKPARLKLLNGCGPGKDSAGRPVNEGPKFVRDAPEPPTWLDREAKAEWRRVVPELARLKLLSRMTPVSLASYCESWSAFVTATKIVHAEGVVAEGRSGPTLHPAFKAQMQASAEMRRWAVEYALTPASEQKVKPVEEPDAAADFD